LRLNDAGVEQGPLARKASDHLPIWADVTLPDPEERPR
jgi:endonuclease/exonuclease/phosphatase family metal-dependent hydrolase